MLNAKSKVIFASIIFISIFYAKSIAFPQAYIDSDRLETFSKISVNGHDLNYWLKLMSYRDSYCCAKATDAFKIAVSDHGDIIPILIKEMNNIYNNLYDAPYYILRNLGPAAVSGLTKSLEKDYKSNIRSKILLDHMNIHNEALGKYLLRRIKDKTISGDFYQLPHYPEIFEKSIPVLLEIMDTPMPEYQTKGVVSGILIDKISIANLLLEKTSDGYRLLLDYIRKKHLLPLDFFSGKHSDSKVVDRILNLLRLNRDVFMEWLLIRILSKFTDDADKISHEIEEYLDENGWNKPIAWITLSRIGGYGHDCLIKRFGQDRANQSIAEYLSLYGQNALPKLIEAVNNNNPSIKRWAVRTIGFMGEEGRESVPMLLEHMNDSDIEFVRDVIWALGRTGKGRKDVLDPLLDVISNRERALDLRAAAVFAIAWLGVKNEKIEKTILHELENVPGNDDRRESGSRLDLWDLRMKELPEMLLKYQPMSLIGCGYSKYLFSNLVYAIYKLNIDTNIAIDLLSESLSKRKTKEEIEYVLFVLGEIGKHPDISVPAIFNATQINDKELRTECLKALMKIKCDCTDIQPFLRRMVTTYHGEPLEFIANELLARDNKK